MENSEIISEPTQCAEIMNNFIIDTSLELDVNRAMHISCSNAVGPILKAIGTYKDHSSILEINFKHCPKSHFNFETAAESLILSIIKDLDSSKSYQKGNIPPYIIKNNKNIYSSFIIAVISNCILSDIFPPNLKDADITPTFKKGDRLLKTNYRPISILPTLSKIYEKVLHIQIYEYFNTIFSKFLCGFRKGISTRHCLLYMLEKIRRYLDKGLKTGILLTDLSKAFNSISHGLLLAKLHAYGFSKISLNLIYNYLKGRRQRTKIRES